MVPIEGLGYSWAAIEEAATFPEGFCNLSTREEVLFHHRIRQGRFSVSMCSLFNLLLGAWPITTHVHLVFIAMLLGAEAAEGDNIEESIRCIRTAFSRGFEEA